MSMVLLILLFTINISAITIAAFILLLLLLFYCCHQITVTTDKLLPERSFSGVVELTTQLLRLINILWLPLCRINKLGSYYPRRLLRSPTLVGHQDYFLASLPRSIALFISSPGIFSVCCGLFFIMKGQRDPKFPILPSTTRKGTALNSKAALDSPTTRELLIAGGQN